MSALPGGGGLPGASEGRVKHPLGVDLCRWVVQWDTLLVLQSQDGPVVGITVWLGGYMKKCSIAWHILLLALQFHSKAVAWTLAEFW